MTVSCVLAHICKMLHTDSCMPNIDRQAFIYHSCIHACLPTEMHNSEFLKIWNLVIQNFRKYRNAETQKFRHYICMKANSSVCIYMCIHVSVYVDYSSTALVHVSAMWKPYLFGYMRKMGTAIYSAYICWLYLALTSYMAYILGPYIHMYVWFYVFMYVFIYMYTCLYGCYNVTHIQGW